LQPDFLERVAAKLRGQEIGAGVIYRVAHAVARQMIYETGRRAMG